MRNALVLAVHGYLGALAVAALVHPAVLLRRGKPPTRGGRLAVLGAALTTTLTFGLGVALYADYRAEVRRALFADSRVAGLLFETKEHLAFGALCLALGGAVAALSASRDAVELRRAAALAFAAAALATLLVVALGTYVAAVRSFAS